MLIIVDNIKMIYLYDKDGYFMNMMNNKIINLGVFEYKKY